ncbi:hypothetical protein IV203_034525 [Nitzschia inconspicua]|uniref:Uncharacterized protein n=1 Tax=Nitzschia inconspicua TaxID=303405 RepID=A0A9K3PTU0_9STRA|nr:hypothetical protein IV203_034525 [Nitzschia inconspicua]
MNAKYFSYPWRSDNFSRHLKQQHPVKWNEYTSLPVEEKQKFFVEKESAEVVNMRSFVQPEGSMKARIIAKQKFQFVIDADIIETLIFGLLFDNSEEEGEEDNSVQLAKRTRTRTLVCKQRQLLTALKQDIMERCYIKGPMTDEESISFFAAVTNDPLHGFHMNNYCVLRQEVANSIDEVGGFVQITMDELRSSSTDADKEAHDYIISTIANFLLQLVSGISNVCAERDNRNNSGDQLPPVLPLICV